MSTGILDSEQALFQGSFNTFKAQGNCCDGLRTILSQVHPWGLWHHGSSPAPFYLGDHVRHLVCYAA